MITILERMPIILTQDRNWIEEASNIKTRPGEIIILPEDAVLVLAPDPKE